MDDTNLSDHTERSLHKCREETEIVQGEQTETFDPSEVSIYSLFIGIEVTPSLRIYPIFPPEFLRELLQAFRDGLRYSEK